MWLVVIAGLAVAETVQLEIVKTVGVAIAAVGSAFGAWLSYKQLVETHKIKNAVNRRRHATRAGENTVVVHDEPEAAE